MLFFPQNQLLQTLQTFRKNVLLHSMASTWQNWQRNNNQATTVVPCRENSALSLSVDADFFYFPSASFILLWGHFCLEPWTLPRGSLQSLFVFPTRWGQGVWDSPGPAGAGPDPSLHAVPGCGRGRSGDPVPARGSARDLRQETLSARKHLPSLPCSHTPHTDLCSAHTQPCGSDNGHGSSCALTLNSYS